MKALDFFTRLIFIPGILFYTLLLVPSFIKDIKEWVTLFYSEDEELEDEKPVQEYLEILTPVSWRCAKV